jgi:hypothetical protein
MTEDESNSAYFDTIATVTPNLKLLQRIFTEVEAGN